ncbi:MAG: M28 family peptidase [Flavobacteriales bacterium]|nr:M28 family peptidase [Flavobacteriales bacterium]
MNLRLTLFCSILAVTLSSNAQNRVYAQKMIDTLCSPIFDGRGYTRDGALKAGIFIEDEMRRIGLKPVRHDFKNYFEFQVNTFPSALSLSVNGRELVPGRDFIVDPSSASYANSGSILVLDPAVLKCKLKRRRVLHKSASGKIVLIDTSAVRNERVDQFKSDYPGGLLLEESKTLTWSVGRQQKSYAHVRVLPGIISAGDEIECQIDAEFKPAQTGMNVVGLLPGSEVPDSFILLTAHYDHLGGMGAQTYVPGANDNASGTAMMLDLASYFTRNPHRYSLAFIAFGGEEAGLLGSRHFVQELEKWFDPSQIRFVVNMDLMGSGEQGMMAVNGKVFTREFEMLKAINAKNQYLTDVRSRGKAANSDHYFFSERGIPAFFFYLMGSYAYYHHIDDSSENLRLGEHYDKAFKLIAAFLSELQKG